jgi:hypothetical protein
VAMVAGSPAAGGGARSRRLRVVVAGSGGSEILFRRAKNNWGAGRGFVYLYSFFLGRGVWDSLRLGDRVVHEVHDVRGRVSNGPPGSDSGLCAGSESRSGSVRVGYTWKALEGVLDSSRVWKEGNSCWIGVGCKMISLHHKFGIFTTKDSL